ncbi:MAG TPA: hypothetical protein VE961_27195 [Pyrinomonadaceae bacterium]|nr:hypothetical protein [Pyrinomonadaceae bacterium]
MKTNSKALSGKLFLLSMVSLFLLPLGAAAQTRSGSTDGLGDSKAAIAPVLEPVGQLDVNAKLKIISGGFFLKRGASLRVLRGRALSPIFNPFVVGTTDANDYLVFNSGGTERARISTDGNLGIGTTSVLSKLHVENGSIFADAANNDSVFNGGGSWSGTANIVGTGAYWAIRTDSSHRINFDVYNSGSPVTAMTMAQSGKVGIGTANPQVTLDTWTSARSTAYNPGDLTTWADQLIKNPTNTSGAATGIAFQLYSSYHPNAGTGIAAVRSDPGNDYQADLAFITRPYQAVAQERMRIRSDGNVGIGTTSPITKLDVNGDIRGTRGTFGYAGIGPNYDLQSYSATGDNRNVFGAGVSGFSNGFTVQYTNSSPSMKYVFADGNVGIGTTAPAYKLDVQGGQLNASGGLCIAGDCKTAWSQVGGGGSSQWANNSSGINYSSGNVGIGLNNPATKLDIAGSLRSTGGTDGYLYLDGTAGGEVMFTKSGAAKWSFGTDVGALSDDLNLFSYTGSAVRMTVLNSNGNVGIGTTNPSERLAITNASGSDGFLLVTGGPGTTKGGVKLGNGGSTYGQLYFDNSNNNVVLQQQYASGDLLLGTNSATNLTIKSGGNVGIGSTLPGYKLDVQGGQVNASGGLCINGDCKTTWSQVGGSSQWANNSSGINYSSGNVGVGTSAPLALMDLNGHGAAGTLLLRDSNAPPQLQFYNQAGNSGFLIKNTGGPAASILQFTKDSANVMTIDNSGRVGIGKDPAVALDVQGDIKASGNISAKYQDVAEWVPSSEQLAVGTVVVLDSTKSNQVTSSTVSYDTRVAGVVSEQPGIALGEKSDTKVLVATTGRVRVKVDATKSPIHIGDLLVTSDTPGIAMKSEPLNLGGVQIHRPGTLIGKALEPLEKGKGEILVLLSLQ